MVEGKNLLRIMGEGAQYPSWSPDGSSLAYSKPTVEGGEIWLMSDDGTDQRVMTSWAASSE